ncbi:MAG: H(+)/Cl(-) exchange transporter ClcA [Bacillota bacterium]|nr:H(+)/Cl(-) exchange transporter ClcA [Bacillota bacterium]
MENKHNTYNSLFHWHSFRLKLVLEGICVGILAGLVVVLYRYALERAGVMLTEVYHNLSQRPLLIPIWLGATVLIGYVVGLMVKYEPMISGSGIPQVEGVLLRKLDMKWWKVIIGKFIGGVLVIGSGLSLGREGPSVQLGAAVGQGFSNVFKRIKIEEKYLITSGASAGLAAAFNAPLAGVMFALEEVHKNFSPLVLLSALSAALSADFVSSQFFGLKPVFHFENLIVLPLRSYAAILVLGVVVGVLGAAFNKMLLGTQTLYARQKWLSKRFWIIIPLLISVVLGFSLPRVLGGGHELIESLVAPGNFTLKILLVLLVTKFLFTMASFGSGAPGGIFLPLLAIGAVIGNIYGVLMVDLFHFDSHFIINFIILAMTGYFTAVVRAPITGTILITEMTGTFSHLLSLALVSIVAYMVADLLGSKPVYESLLDRILRKQGEGVVPGDEGTKSILEFAVCMGSTLDGKQIKDVKWPAHCLLVSVKRGNEEIIPKGDTTIYPGDYLIVLTNEDRVSKINDAMNRLAVSCEI